MSKFKPGDLVTATKNPSRQAMKQEGLILGEVLEELSDCNWAGDEGYWIVRVILCERHRSGNGLSYKVGEEISREGFWFDLVT